MIDRQVNGGFNNRKVLNGQDFSICFHADILILILMLWQEERELHVRRQTLMDKQEIAITSQ